MKLTDTSALLDQAAQNWVWSLTSTEIAELSARHEMGESGHLLDGFLSMAEKAAGPWLAQRLS